MGGKIEAFSGFNSFGIEIEVLKDDLDEALIILKDVLLEPSFPQPELEKERSRTIAAIKEEDDDIFARGTIELLKAVFAGTAYSLRLSGTQSSVSSIGPSDLKKFHEEHVVAQNLVISVSGDVDPALTASMVKSLFGNMRNGRIIQKNIVTASGVSRSRKEINMGREETLVLFGYRSAPASDPDRYALDVLASVLSGHSGRLFARIRSARSLAYALGCAARPLPDAGYFAAYVATAKAEMKSAEDSLSTEIELARAKDIPGAEVESAKRELLSGHRISMQSNSFVATTSALDELYGIGYDDIYRYESSVNAVTAADLKRVSTKYLDPEFRACVILSPER
jgi:zinc protease